MKKIILAVVVGMAFASIGSAAGNSGQSHPVKRSHKVLDGLKRAQSKRFLDFNININVNVSSTTVGVNTNDNVQVGTIGATQSAQQNSNPKPNPRKK